ncbi:RNI-like protein [Guyanagaster necrorhizus]|uniref:RNI-like protein n=1 Tax=Guyanagaster necrorhizus TaxID=856835 RepID=A0A9P7W2V8_9AGAR|nr:RNI-like protein [Guyanagaster necrorhizus MCA 3950]KAG7450326.1 RNI-like protein [Guyanagaster necrorhizus MCA 3950]
MIQYYVIFIYVFFSLEMSRRPNPNKKHRTAGPVFGAPSEADSPSAQLNYPSSAASSTRLLPIYSVPSLVSLCARLFTANFVKLHNRERIWKRTSHYLQLVPEELKDRIFGMLSVAWPTYLSHEIIVTYFLNGSSLTLSNALPGVNRNTISSIKRFGASLRELRLTGFEKIPDEVFASILPNVPQLKVLVLRGCSKVGSNTVLAASKCTQLTVANFNYTSATPTSLAVLLAACSELQVLKLAKVSNWRDTTFSKFLSAVDETFRHANLCNLKLRQTAVSDHSIVALTTICPNLRRLDVAFTGIRKPSLWVGQAPHLEKLSLTSTAISSGELCIAVESLPQLKTLAIGALGVGTSPNTTITNTSSMTLNDDDLILVSNLLAEHGRPLESLSLVSNTKLGLIRRESSALCHMISLVGRKCKYLNLSSISCLRSSDLAGLMPTFEYDEPCALQTLILNNTGVDDEVAPFISCCPELATLELSGTKVTDDGLFPIIDACPKLVNLDLTSCRGVNVVNRRRFFEVWEQSR